MQMYQLFLIPLFTVIFTQITKSIIDATRGKFSFKDINSYGGMPSAHASFCTSLCVMIGYFEGWSSAAFAISIVMTFIIIRDAVGFRQEIGKHAKILNVYLKQLPPENNHQYNYLRERIGHTGLEILGGITLGVIIPILYILFFA